MDIIVDGTGSGYKAQVDSDNKLAVASVSRSYLSYISAVKELAFAVTTGFLTVTTTGGRVLFIKNTDPNRKICLDRFFGYWDGGTDGTKVCQILICNGDTAPTTNIVVSAAGNMNQGSTKVALADVLVWNGVGDGMTGGTPVAAGNAAMFTRGSQENNLDGTIILPYDKTISINAKGITAGVVAVAIVFHYEDN